MTPWLRRLCTERAVCVSHFRSLQCGSNTTKTLLFKYCNDDIIFSKANKQLIYVYIKPKNKLTRQSGK